MFFFFQAEDGIRDLVRSRGLGDVYKRQVTTDVNGIFELRKVPLGRQSLQINCIGYEPEIYNCLLYTSDAADERSSVDLGGRRIIKKKKQRHVREATDIITQLT